VNFAQRKVKPKMDDDFKGMLMLMLMYMLYEVLPAAC